MTTFRTMRETVPYYRGVASMASPTGEPSSTRWPDKEDCPGCVALVDDQGRFQPGFCGADCVMKSYRDQRIPRRTDG